MGWTRRAYLASGAAALAGCSVSVESETPMPTASGTEADTTLGFGGDAMLARSVTDRWAGTDPAGVWGDLQTRLAGLDGFVCNLECCISTRGTKWPDKVYYFRADPEFATGALDAAGTTAVSLANNHTLDYGATGLTDTLDYLDTVDVGYAGAGTNLDEAFAPTVHEVGDCTVAVVSFTDQWPAYRAGFDSPGTAYLALNRDKARTRQRVRRTLSRANEADPDLVVASLHWGPNWVVAPDRRQQAFARWLIDEGVDVVHGHSAHVLQGVETYRGSPILYDTADIVDDFVVKEELHNDRSALFELALRDGEMVGVRVVPVHIENETVDTADEDVAQWVRDRIRTLSGEFGTTIRRDGSSLWIPLER